MLQIVRKRILITGKGQVRKEHISLPNNACRILGVIVQNTSVLEAGFPEAPPYTIPPTSPLSATGVDTEVQTDILIAVASGTGYAKYDKVERRITYTYTNGTLTNTVSAYLNLETDTDITGTVNVAHLQVPVEESAFLGLGSALSVAFTTTKVDYPFGLTLPTEYREVVVSFEADATTLTTDLGKMARIGETSTLTAAIGTRVSEGTKVTLTKEEFESLSIIGLQAGKTHTMQVQIIT